MKRFLLLLLMFGIACNDETSNAPTPLIIVPAISTRVTGTNFDNGDQIGLNVTLASETYLENRRLTYNGTTFSDEGLTWYADPEANSTLTAYYPYSANGVPKEFAIVTDQRNGYASSDLLGAVRTDIKPESSPISMIFYHLLSQLTIIVDNATSSKVANVTIGGTIPVADVDFTTLTATAKSDTEKASIQACCITENRSYRAILVPQQGDLEISVTMESGTEYRKSLSEVTLVSGKRYDLSITISTAGMNFALQGEINDWQEGGILTGNIGNTSESLTYAGETYSTTTIAGNEWMSENLRYAPDGAAAGIDYWYPAGNRENVATLGLLYSYTTATSGNTEANTEQVQGICPAGWHIPTADELATLITAEDRNAEFLVCAGARNISSGIDVSTTKGYLMGSTLSEGKFTALSFTSTGTTLTQTAFATTGMAVSVRCVKNK
ncbi:MAG: hypothetical protein E7148_07200 [Rikenellaceae bacterium]|nr:hypothetical protein [Rikenellaceae bacterium]